MSSSGKSRACNHWGMLNMAVQNDFIEYVAVPLPETVVVEEFKPYKGLEPFFDRVESLPAAKDTKSGLTLMLLEMDSALHAYKAGEMDNAVKYHENFLNRAKGVFKSADVQAQTQARRAVQKLFISLTTEAMRGQRLANGARGKPQAWGHALKDISKAFRARQHALTHLELQPVVDDVVFTQPHRRMGVQDAFTYASMAETPKRVKEPWTCTEHKNLAIVLEAFQQKGSPVRKDAIVALASLNAINRDEYNWSKGAGDDSRAHYAEYLKRLDRTVHAMLTSKAITEGQRAGLRRFYKPAHDHAKHFKGAMGGGALSRVFHVAASTLLKKAVTVGIKAAAGLILKKVPLAKL